MTIDPAPPADAATETITVLFTPNANYAQHTAACIASLLKHSRARLDVVIASTEDPSTFAERLRRSFDGNPRVSLTFRHFDVPNAGILRVDNKRLSPDMFLRFWATELAPGRARAIYLDPDIIAVGDIDPLWRTNLHGKVMGAVPIPNSIRLREHEFPPGAHYFNSGVLLFDLDAWEARRCRERCLDFLRDFPERVHDPDQDVMNLVLMGEWLQLDYIWNVINPFYRPSYDLGLSGQEVARVLADARIVHFNGPHKPWVYLDNHPRQADYMASLGQTDWRDWRPPDRSALNAARKWISRVLPPWAKRAGRILLKRQR